VDRSDPKTERSQHATTISTTSKALTRIGGGKLVVIRSLRDAVRRAKRHVGVHGRHIHAPRRGEVRRHPRARFDMAMDFRADLRAPVRDDYSGSVHEKSMRANNVNVSGVAGAGKCIDGFERAGLRLIGRREQYLAHCWSVEVVRRGEARNEAAADGFKCDRREVRQRPQDVHGRSLASLQARPNAICRCGSGRRWYRTNGNG
jgi:hypothetical protein